MSTEAASVGLTWEEMAPGRVVTTARRTVSETDIVNYVNAMGFTEPLFIDMEHVRDATPFGTRIAPGLLTLSLAEGLVIQSRVMQSTAIALVHLEFEASAPVRPDDTLGVAIEFVESRATSASSARGVVRSRNVVTNQHGDVVLTYHPVRLIRGRSAMPTAAGSVAPGTTTAAAEPE